ncbi:DUF2958 domain-containing protein [Allomesorhizobium alhagi]|uniref:Single-stranded DNA endonuclease n=1 Tax=Mesorhizobium alhagi CCNWXJ12-2 TaxID=1107882 RepID=H0HXI7_9HYPH|nr:DUF2958 domain-containing protein [Mesorhizobium alhagi]EHK54598.1 hypothetical protein MAXJ12_24552 [Mesorhizobium alhagi CCNWXJ12-2]
MTLIPENLRARLASNGAAEPETDHIPLVKLFDPCGPATWLVTEMMQDGDTLFGLADLGFGSPELGSFSLSEMETVKGAFGLGIERDIHFVGRFPLCVYAAAARNKGCIVEAEAVLRRFAAALGNPQPPEFEIPSPEQEHGDG